MYFNIFCQLNANCFDASNCEIKKNHIVIFTNPIVVLGCRLVYV